MCVLFCLGTWTPEAHQGGRTSAACTQRGLFRHACCAPRPVALASAGRLAATHTPRSPPTPTPSPTPTPPLPAHPPTYTPHPPTTHTHTYTAPTHTQSTHPRMRTHTRACSPYLTICPPPPPPVPASHSCTQHPTARHAIARPLLLLCTDMCNVCSTLHIRSPSFRSVPCELLLAARHICCTAPHIPLSLQLSICPSCSCA